ncbi:hypothetical protein D9M68_282360 [compost metagenome]
MAASGRRQSIAAMGRSYKGVAAVGWKATRWKTAKRFPPGHQSTAINLPWVCNENRWA